MNTYYSIVYQLIVIIMSNRLGCTEYANSRNQKTTDHSQEKTIPMDRDTEKSPNLSTISCNIDKKHSEHKIGQGGHGIVYKTSSAMVRKVSLWYEEEYGLSDSAIREICFLRSFSHPNILKLHKVNKTGDEISMSMPYAGKSFQDWVVSEKLEYILASLPYIVFQIAQTLQFLEKYNICHSDIKPSNILIDSNNKLSLIDWGAVSFNPRVNRTCLCTYIFAAPELLEKGIQSPKADIYSLGLLIKFAMHKKYQFSPFLRKQEIIHQYAKHRVIYNRVGLHAKNYFIPEKLRPFFEKCKVFLKYNPTQRPSASEIYAWEEFSAFKKDNFSYGVIPFIPVIKNGWDMIENGAYLRRTIISWINEGIYRIIRTDPVLFMHTAYLLDRYIGEYHATIDMEKIRLIAISCAILTFCMYNQHSEYDIVYKWCKNMFSPQAVQQSVWDVFEKLNYQIHLEPFINHHNINRHHVENIVIECNITMSNEEKLKNYNDLENSTMKESSILQNISLSNESEPLSRSKNSPLVSVSKTYSSAANKSDEKSATITEESADNKESLNMTYYSDEKLI